VGGAWYPTGGAIADLITKNIKGVSCTAIASGGAISNVKMLGQGTAHIVFTFPAPMQDAMNGVEDFAKDKITNVRGIVVKYTEYWQLPVLADSPIKSVPDLKNRTLATLVKGNVGEQMTRRVLEAHGITYKDLKKVHHVSFADAGSLMQDGHVDGIALIGPLYIPNIGEVSMSRAIRLVPLSEDMVGKILKKYPAYSRVVVPAGVYKNVNQSTVTVGEAAIIAVRADLSDNLVYQITKVIHENKPGLVSVAKALSEMSPESSVKYMGVPIHPGAQKYYREVGALK